MEMQARFQIGPLWKTRTYSITQNYWDDEVVSFCFANILLEDTKSLIAVCTVRARVDQF